jgi:SRSO17 transposase
MEGLAMTALEDTAAWAAELERLGARLAPRFTRVEPRRRLLAYLRGLLAPGERVERKNGWQLAESAGDATPDGMQAFLGRMRWHADQVRDDLRAYLVEHLGDPGAVLVLDETGFVKKGSHSVGVQRQYSGTAGRIENCQIGVFLAYAGPKGQALLDRALYLPESWAKDARRRTQAGVPDAVAFATKPKLGRIMLERAFAAAVPCAWVVGDSVYGADHALRRCVEQGGRGYVLAVTSTQRLGLKPVEDWLEDVPGKGWRRLSAGDGAKGPRFYDWAWLPYRSLAAAGWQKGLLIRRSLTEPDKLAFHLTLAPAATSLADLVRVAGTRWTIEACFEAAKGEVGLDQYEVRAWTGWYRHGTLAMLAHVYLAVVRQAAIGGTADRRPRRRAGAPHRARGAPPAVAAGLGAPARSGAGDRLVALAPSPPAAGPPLPLATTNRP